MSSEILRKDYFEGHFGGHFEGVTRVRIYKPERIITDYPKANHGYIASQGPEPPSESKQHNKVSQRKFLDFPVHIKVIFTLYCSLLSGQ